MAITTQLYDGAEFEADEVGWAGVTGSFGSDYGVRGLTPNTPDENAGRVTTVPSADRTVAVAPAIFYGHGVRDRSDSTVNVQLPSVPTGQARWFLVAVRRDWQNNVTTIAAVPDGQASKVIPSQRNANPGVRDDQPLALVQITGGQSIPTAVVDLRCWSGNSGLMAADTLALSYLSRLGSTVIIGGVQWDRLLDAQGSPVWVERNPNPISVAGSTYPYPQVKVGDVQVDTNASGDGDIVFPQAFPTQMFTATLTDATATAVYGAIILKFTASMASRSRITFRAYTTTGAVLRNASFRVTYLAVGR